MRILCVLEDSGQLLFTLNTMDSVLRKNDLIEADEVTYKVESVLFKVTVRPNGIQTGEEGEPSVTIPGEERSWSSGMLLVTLSVVP